MNSGFRVSLVGSLAVGKSTIVDRLKNIMENCIFVVEDPSKNVFLEDFYADMPKWGFHSQISSLAMITENYLSYDKGKVIIYDRCVDEMITFAMMQFEHGNMNEKEFKVYKSLYNSILALIPPVDLFIYCKCSAEISLERIKARNRIYEQNIDINYLREVNAYYETWINTIEKNRVEIIDTSARIDVQLLCDVIMRRIKGNLLEVRRLDNT